MDGDHCYAYPTPSFALSPPKQRRHVIGPQLINYLPRPDFNVKWNRL